MADTAIETAATTAVAPFDENFAQDLGLGDFDSSDMVMPRLSIEHQKGVYVDNLTGEEFPELNVVLLGLVKQRIMWHPDPDHDGGPLCKSIDAKTGNPGKDFPWDATNFSQPTDGQSKPLPCDSCALTEWGSHPKNNTPWCSEQYTLPLLMEAKGTGEFIAPAILTVQRSGVKPARAYMTAFKRSQSPLFTVVTRLTLNTNKKGTVTFSVPVFAKAGETERENWGEYATHYQSIRSYLTTKVEEDEVEASASGSSSNESEGAKSDKDLPF